MFEHQFHNIFDAVFERGSHFRYSNKHSMYFFLVIFSLMSWHAYMKYYIRSRMYTKKSISILKKENISDGARALEARAKPG